MSAKATYAKPAMGHPELPAELWLSIFAFATEVPEALDQSQSLFQFPGEVRAIQKYKKSCRLSLITKRRLLLVCKQWRSLATPFLYRQFLLEHQRTLPLLLRTLSASSRNSQENGAVTPLGFFAKRLDICLREESVDVDATRKLGETLGEILYYLPNTKVIVFCGRDYRKVKLPPVFISALEEVGSSLEILNWQSPAFSPSSESYHAVFSNTPNLTSLQLRLDDLTELLSSLPVLPHLQTLSLLSPKAPWPAEPEPPLEHMPVNPFPALTQIRLNHVWVINLAQVQAILQLCGPTISSVSLSSFQTEEVDWQPIIAMLSQLGLRMSYLTLHTPYMYIYDVKAGLSLPPSVHTLGLRFQLTQASKFVYNHVLDQVTSLKGDGLKVVRLDDRNVLDFRYKHAAVAQELAKALEAQGRRLEFGEGVGIGSRLR
ncbi:hypothetical protein D9758_012338 [Tetrapyrgos nigripes]|uniref:F-box domain-containing protein n=1 Tax=Tetrapyrgos nigripes TaxID=182062 RepID=A0A8H5CM45_9AGAR|nr:hypothetical protein D9758_012338 [Tetrapyrgos nigripes]